MSRLSVKNACHTNSYYENCTIGIFSLQKVGEKLAFSVEKNEGKNYLFFCEENWHNFFLFCKKPEKFYFCFDLITR